MKHRILLLIVCVLTSGAHFAESNNSAGGLSSFRWLRELEQDSSKHQQAIVFKTELKENPGKWIQMAESFARNDTDLRVRNLARLELAEVYRNRAQLSRNIKHLTDAWEAVSRDHDPGNQRIADHALSQLVYSLSSVGRVQELQKLFSETHGRIFVEEGDQQIYERAREAFLVMRANPGIAYRCGTAALYEVIKAIDPSNRQIVALNYADSPEGGFTLVRLKELGVSLGVETRAIRIQPNAEIPVPSVVHWKSDHYAAVVRKEGDHYEIIDHTLNLHLYLSEEELREESTGHFLTPEELQAGWISLSAREASEVVGRGYPNLLVDAKDFGCLNIANPDGCKSCRGLPEWFVSEPYINLWVQDVPFFYSTTDGQIEFKLSFRQRDPRKIDWPINFATNHWMHNWISFVKFNGKGTPNNSPFYYGYKARVYTPEGSVLNFEDTQRFDPQSGAFFTPIRPFNGQSGHMDISVDSSRDNYFGFKLAYPDGTISVYGCVQQSGFVAIDESTATGHALLTQIIDPKGRTNRYFYETNIATVRLKSMVDYDGKTNSLYYYTNSNRLWYVQSPYGAAATLDYDSSNRVSNVTDSVGLKSVFTYNADGAMATMKTPYGTNSFAYYEAGNTNTNNNAGGHELVNRALRVTDANGGKHLYVFKYDSPGLVPTNFPSSQVPQSGDVSLPIGTLDLGSSDNSNVAAYGFRNSFYWNPKTDSGTAINSLNTLNSADYAKARWRHWLIENDPVVVTTSSALSFERDGAPSSGVTGAVLWFDYYDKPGGAREKVGTNHRPGLAAVRLENGETAFQQFEYNAWGFPSSIKSTYRQPAGTEMETTTTSFSYSATLANETLKYGAFEPLTWQTLTNVSYTNLTLLSVSVDGQIRLGLGNGNETYTNTFVFFKPAEFPDLGDSDQYWATTNIGVFPQPRWITNSLQETIAEMYYGEKRRMEAVFRPTGGTEFNYFTNGTNIGKLQTVVETAGDLTRETEFTYAANGTIGSVETPLGLTITTVFDHLYRPVQFSFPAQSGSHGSSTTTFSYTPVSGTNVTGSTNLLDVTKITDRRGGETKFEYTPLRSVRKITDAESRVTDYLYSCSCGALDAISNSLQVVSFDYDWQSRLTGVTSPDTTRVQYDYDSFGQLKKISESTTNFVGFTYDIQGLPNSVSNQFGAVWSGAYDNLGRLTRYTNGFGVKLGLDNLGRLASTAYREGSAWVTNQTWGFSTNVYPPTSHVNALSEISSFEYDGFNLLTKWGQVGIGTNKFGYNAAGQLTGFTNDLGAKTFWAYDTEGRLLRKVNDSGQTNVSFYYFENGLVSNRVDALNAVKYTYDLIGNVRTNTYASRFELFTYDALNRLLTMTDVVGSHVFAYTNGFLISEDGPWVSDKISYQYSHLQRSKLTSENLLGNREISYRYDEAGRLSKLISPAGSFGYDYVTGAFGAQAGLFQKLNLPGGGAISNSFEHTLGFLTKTALRSPAGSESLTNGYLYDLAGQVKTNFHSDGTRTGFDYHAHGALRSAIGYESTGTVRPQENLGYNYDAAGNLITRTNAGLIQTFTTNKLNQYTAANASGTITVSGVASANATTVTVNGVAATLNADKTFYKASVPITDAVFTAIATNASTGFSATDKVTNIWSSAITPTYDAYGNLKTFGNRIFAYNEENRLASVIVTNSSTDSKKVEFNYDGLGRKRIRKEFKWQSGSWVSAGSGETRFLYDGSLVVEERNSANQTTVQYTRAGGANGIGDLLARTDSGAHTYYQSDRVGNVVALVDAGGIVQAQYSYDPYGRVTEKVGTLADANKYQFSSRELDPIAGVFDLGGRFYDPGFQRFLNPDPSGENGGLNLYQSFFNAPTSFVDPTGKDNMYVNATALAANSVQNAPVVGVFSMRPILYQPLVFPTLNNQNGIVPVPPWSQFQLGQPTFTGNYKISSEFKPADPIPGFAAFVAKNIIIAAATEGAGLGLRALGEGAMCISAAEKTVDLYRAVGVREFNDVMANKVFQGAGNSMSARQFGFTMEEALKFANADPSKVAILKATVPESILPKLDFSKTIDSFIFKNGVITVHPEMQPLFNQSLKAVEHVY